VSVYLVSVQRLAAARRERFRNPRLPMATGATKAAETRDEAQGNEANRVSARVAPSPTNPTVPTKSNAGLEVQGHSIPETGEPVRCEVDFPLAASVEELLRLPREQVKALLADCRESSSKVLLALIYRLSAVESELQDLAAKVRSSGGRALQAAMMVPAVPVAGGGGKTELLEKVFQKNLSLRKRNR